jgi:hypothetical protein
VQQLRLGVGVPCRTSHQASSADEAGGPFGAGGAFEPTSASSRDGGHHCPLTLTSRGDRTGP